ncbi:hypothetical protein [Leekyejoonella antrihumi]|uniref:Uncharacterized protein n=1 Tax=Leekyejoonella antrihumi TaxID=1660198 RepID=A0A563DPM6_9MICO|nr:hypothetical protein [Leekyejoonella antrihumi]TWP32167.1 hypothetical protein FGL98_24625 [Leekyejoonella antrihumi]
MRADSDDALIEVVDRDVDDMTEQPAAHFDETTLARLDAACDRADALNARVATLLGETRPTARGRRSEGYRIVASA